MEQTVRLLFFLTAQNDITFTMQHKQNLLSYIDQIIIFMSGTYVCYVFLFILMPQLWEKICRSWQLLTCGAMSETGLQLPLLVIVPLFH